MATLAELKTRIIDETNRDDLSDDLATLLQTHIARACEYYADERFWFNALITTVDTVSASGSVTLPATVRRVERVSIPTYFRDLSEVTLGELNPDTVASAIPYSYAYYNNTLRLYPIPDAVYSLRLVGTLQIDAPTDDSDESTAWTNEAYDLICGRVKETLMRSAFRDPEGAGLARGEAMEALAKLKRETAKRLETPLRPRMARRAFNINTGD